MQTILVMNVNNLKFVQVNNKDVKRFEHFQQGNTLFIKTFLKD